MRVPGRGRVVVDAVGDGLSGGRSDGPQVAEVGAEGHVRVTGGEVDEAAALRLGLAHREGRYEERSERVRVPGQGPCCG